MIISKKNDNTTTNNDDKDSDYDNDNDDNKNSNKNSENMMTTRKRITRTPAFWDTPPLPHDYPHWWFTSDPKSKEDKVKNTNFKKLPKIQILKFCKKLYTRHTFWSCMIRCINMNWIQPEL